MFIKIKTLRLFAPTNKALQICSHNQVVVWHTLKHPPSSNLIKEKCSGMRIIGKFYLFSALVQNTRYLYTQTNVAPLSECFYTRRGHNFSQNHIQNCHASYMKEYLFHFFWHSYRNTKLMSVTCSSYFSGVLIIIRKFNIYIAVFVFICFKSILKR